MTKYKVGDIVRVSKYKKLFEKGYTPNWTTENFKIVAINRKKPVTFILKDLNNEVIAGRFYEHEISIVKHPHVYLVEKILKEKNNKLYVKWLGFDTKQNSWIDEWDIV